MPTLFSTNLYQEAVGIDAKMLEFKAGKTVLQVYYSVDKDTNHFYIGKQSTFGHVEFLGEGDLASVRGCLESLFRHIYQNHKRFTVKFAPLFYFKDMSIQIKTALKGIDNIQVIEDCNQSMYINKEVEFIANFSKTHRRIYKKLEQSGHYVLRSEKLSLEGYSVLQESRENRNVDLSLTYASLEAQVQKLEGHFQFFECRTEDNALCAYAVTLKISSDWLYVFYWGEKKLFRKRSPVVMLAANIMAHCKHYGINRLDAGISSVSGTLDQNLFDFKRRLGFVPSEKITVLGGL